MVLAASAEFGRTSRERPLVRDGAVLDDRDVEPPIDHSDVTTIMAREQDEASARKRPV